ncbi:MAG: tetratricopeptide repeat protein [Planctomycetaceae bacterium]
MVKVFRLRPLILLALLIAIVAVVGWRFTDRAPEISAPDRFQRAVRALLDGDLSQAEADLAELPQDRAFLPHTRLLTGGILLRSGNPSAALPWLSAVEPADELRQPSLLLLGECYYRLQRHAEAEMCFLYVVEDEPDQVDARRWLGSIYYDLGTVNAAMLQIQRVVELDPDDYRPHRLLGVISYDLEKYDDAAAEFQAALDRNPSAEHREQLYLELARARVKLRQYDQALESLSKAPGLAGDAAALAVRAECAFSLGESDQAGELLKQVLQEEPDNRDALLLSADIAQQSQRWPEAIAALQKILDSSPQDHEARYLLGIIYGQAGQKELSQQQLQLSEESLLLRTEATELYRQADQHPTEPRYREELAAICEKMGEPELAEMWRRAAEALRVRRTMRGTGNSVSAPVTPE